MPFLLLALGTALMLPAPGTQSTSRDFCKEWLDLSTVEKHGVLVHAERLEVSPGPEASCRAGRRAALRLELDAECRNWRQLMDFEVRAIVEGVLEPCETDRQSGDRDR